MAYHTRPLVAINADFQAASKHNIALLRLHPGYVEAVRENSLLRPAGPASRSRAESSRRARSGSKYLIL